jgi:hypothetical protein
MPALGNCRRQQQEASVPAFAVLAIPEVVRMLQDLLNFSSLTELTDWLTWAWHSRAKWNGMEWYSVVVALWLNSFDVMCAPAALH